MPQIMPMLWMYLYFFIFMLLMIFLNFYYFMLSDYNFLKINLKILNFKNIWIWKW